ncbi:hypothetical protein V9T40_014623 [Parthenolecanium corni]|uniref:Ig-like domain-containing protein n=1 Tax=Parthenolecanium corni TaxID=536013 RepID=A0AAN9T665_9HEMI
MPKVLKGEKRANQYPNFDCYLFLRLEMGERKCLAFSNQSNEGLKNVRLKADPAVQSGDILRLECDYDLENAQLYSIKWYFGDDEFYRFVPKESPPTRVFPLPGVVVDLTKSDHRVVNLENVQRNLTGYYACEVSADAPLFHTDVKKALIIVVESPRDSPRIFAKKKNFSQSGKIEASCVSTKSYPATNLTWYINGRRAQNDTFKKITNLIELELGSLETSKSKLEITSPSLGGVFVDGKLKLLCQATLFSIYNGTNEIEIVDDTPQLAHVLSPTPSDAFVNQINKARKITAS